MNRGIIGLVMSIVATICIVASLALGLEGTLGETIVGIGLFFGILSWFFCGFVTVLKCCFGAALFGRMFDFSVWGLGLAAMWFCIVLVACMLLPVIPVGIAFAQNYS